MNALLVLTLASASLLHDWSKVSLLGWTRDGSAVAWEAAVQSLEKPDGVLPCERVFMVVADSNGRALGVYRLRSHVPMDEVTWIDPQTDSLWEASLGETEAQKWIDTHRLLPAASPRKLSRTLEDKSGRERLKATLLTNGKPCPSATLTVALGGAVGSVARDDCPEDETPGKGFGSTLQVGWSPDGRHAALAWNTTRPGRTDDVIRGHAALASRRALSRVEVLSGGSQKRADSVAAELERAGFIVTRRGIASAPAEATSVSYASGYQGEAQAIARIVGIEAMAIHSAKGKPTYPLQVIVGR
jgi:LytR cell envelope-related transcriptional attenuator